MGEKGIAGTRLSKLGRYEVLSELGKGAMGIVYLAKDPVIGRMVAIKTIRASSMGDDDSESREFRERFIREAQTAGILSHPHIVTIHDIGEDPDTQTSFIAMEYIEGKNLKSLLNERAGFSYDQIAEMIAQVAEAIDYAHRKGIIHRDIKPANIIITTDEKVKITDFGIAKVASSNLTTTGQFLGTPNYMSPEQVSGAPVDGRSDIFSLGVVLYELLTHRKPFVGENLTAISYKIVHEDFTPPAELASEVPTEFNPIVARAMAKDPWNRYQRGKDFALALHQLRAHLEEQRALQDLGTIVSQAEFLPTLKLANMDQLVAEEQARQAADPSAPHPRTTEVLPPRGEATQNLRATQPDAPAGAAGAATIGSSTAASRATAPDLRATPESGTPSVPPFPAATPITPMPKVPVRCPRSRRPPREPPPRLCVRRRRRRFSFLRRTDPAQLGPRGEETTGSGAGQAPPRRFLFPESPRHPARYEQGEEAAHLEPVGPQARRAPDASEDPGLEEALEVRSEPALGMAGDRRCRPLLRHHHRRAVPAPRDGLPADGRRGPGARRGDQGAQGKSRDRQEALHGREVRREPRALPQGPRPQPEQRTGAAVRADGGKRAHGQGRSQAEER